MTTVGFSVLALAPDRMGPLPDAAEVRQAAKEVLARPEFQIDGSTEAAESLWALLNRFFGAVSGAFRAFFEWLYRMSPVLAWLLVGVLVFTVLILVAHIAWTIVMVVRRGRQEGLLEDDLAAKMVNPAELARQAELARAEGNYILGVRLLFRACLTLLEHREGKRFRPGATNREHLNRYRQTDMYDWLARFVWVIDSKWYGSQACLPADFAACHEAYERINALAVEREHAQHA